MSTEFDKELELLEQLSSQLADVSVEEKTTEASIEEKGDTVTEDVEVNSNVEEPQEVDDLAEKADKIMSMMKKPKSNEPSVFMTDIRFKEMEENGELIDDDQYESLAEDEKGMYERVNVMDEETKMGMGMRWRLREGSMKSEDDDVEEKGMGSSDKKPRSVFLTDIRFKKMMDSGELMDDEAYGKLSDDEKSNCMKVDVYNEKTKKGMGAYWRRRMPMEREQEVKKGEKSLQEDVQAKSEDSFRCGIQQKSVEEVCDFCRGGCKSENGLPGLEQIETMVKSAFEGAEIIDSGYSSAEDMFLVDVKRADGDYIEVAYSGKGDQLGWFVIDPDMVENRGQTDIISAKDAQSAASEVVEGSVMGVFPDVFEDSDVYSVQIETEAKSYDVYVGLDGTVIGYDEYDLEQELPEEEEIKALEAELEIKRMYSREQRMQMAEAGDALPDGSFPIADKADLQNAIQAFGRAGDKEAAKKHIIKRAKELGMEDMLPENWMSDEEKPEEGSNPQQAAKPNAEDMEAEKGALDILDDLDEFTKLMSEITNEEA